jgi:hypothetical protein
MPRYRSISRFDVCGKAQQRSTGIRPVRTQVASRKALHVGSSTQSICQRRIAKGHRLPQRCALLGYFGLFMHTHTNAEKHIHLSIHLSIHIANTALGIPAPFRSRQTGLGCGSLPQLHSAKLARLEQHAVSNCRGRCVAELVAAPFVHLESR